MSLRNRLDFFSVVLTVLFVSKNACSFRAATTVWTTVTPTTPLSPVTMFALGSLAKKSKKAELRKYIEEGMEESVMEKYNLMKEMFSQVDLVNQTPGPLQRELTRRKGTITVIAEYKRKNSCLKQGFIKEIYFPELLSSIFREFGASAVAVMADERMGGCTYNDLATFVEEQRRSQAKVPGPIMVINNDLIVDEIQVARTAAYGAVACVITYSVVGEDDLPMLLRMAKALNIEVIVAVGSASEAQKAIDLGARIINVVSGDGVDGKVSVIESLRIPMGQQVCTIANILTRNDQALQEIEEAWAVRDKGFNCVWIGEALYKSGSLDIEHPGAIIRSIKSKSSLKWATPKASKGRGEGAREYLGDILM